jgi:hypothetical protein
LTDPEVREDEPFTRAASSPLGAWGRHWVSGTLIALLFAAVGAAGALLVPVTYTAETRVAVGSGDLTSGAIAGFPLAASQLASNYARYVNDRGVAGTDVPEGVDLSASQIPDSNVIRVEAVSSDPDAARTAANSAANELITTVNSSGSESIDSVFTQFSEAADTDAAAQTTLAAAQHDLDEKLAKDASAASIKAARSAVSKAAAEADRTSLTSSALRQKYTNLVSGTSSAAKLQLVRDAESVTSNRVSWIERLGLLGLAVGLGVSLAVAVARERASAPTPVRAAGTAEEDAVKTPTP